MGLPRLVCTAVRTSPGWLAGLSDDTDDPGAAPVRPLGAGVHWRLLSANNRQLGRGAYAFPDRRSAALAAGRLAQGLLDAEPEVVLLGRRYGWGWTVTLAGHAEAISGRGYERSGLAAHALHLFLTGLPAAVGNGSGTGPVAPAAPGTVVSPSPARPHC